MAADGHLGMTALSRVTLASAGLSCLYYVTDRVLVCSTMRQNKYFASVQRRICSSTNMRFVLVDAGMFLTQSTSVIQLISILLTFILSYTHTWPSWWFDLAAGP